MSKITVSSIEGTAASANTISVPSGHKLYVPGSVVQVQMVRYDSRITTTAQAGGDGTTLTQLQIPITPKFSNSKLVMQWVLQGEIHHDAGFVIHKDGSLITTAGETGYNAESGNTRWSAFAASSYDQNQDSTPGTYTIQYFASAGSTSARTYAPAVKGTGASAYTFSLNRVIGSSGQDNYENLVSTGIIWEIAQ